MISSGTVGSREINLTTGTDGAWLIGGIAARGNSGTFSLTGGATQIQTSDTGGSGTSDVDGIVAYEEVATADAATFDINWTNSVRIAGFEMDVKPGAGGAAAQTITGAAHSDPDTFAAGLVTAGAVQITGTALSDPDTIGGGQISTNYRISGVALVDPDQFGSGTVGQTGALQTIPGAAHVDADAFGSGLVVAGPVQIVGTLHVDGDAFGAGAVSAGVVVQGTLFADPDGFGGGIVVPGAVNIDGAGHADPDTIGSGIVSQDGGPQSIIGAAANDPDTFGTGLVSAGSIGISGAIFVDPGQISCKRCFDLAVTHKSCGELIHPPDLVLPEK